MSRKPTPRAVMLDAALEALHAGEFTMGGVARRAGITRQALYRHFDGLAELAIATARHVDEVHDVAAELAPVVAATNGEDFVAEMAAFYGRYNPKIAATVRCAERVVEQSPQSRAALQDRRRIRLAGCRTGIDRLRAWGELREGWDPDEAAAWLETMGSVALWHEQVVEAGWSAEQYVRVLHKALKASLLQPRLRSA